MQGPIRCVLFAGMLLGCDPGDTNTPEDDGGIVGPSGLVIEWSSAPASWPADVGDGVTLKCARFAMNNLRVVGDAGPGDPRTTASAMEMRFAWDNDCSKADQRPTNITFDDAPTGLYSQVAIVLDRDSSGTGSDDSYEIEGTVMLGSQLWEWKIQDTNAVNFNVGIDEMVSPGEIATIPLRINFTHALDSVDWATLDLSDGRLELEQGDTQMPTFRAKLIESFEIVSGGGSGGVR
jgi:hypothetical protein